MIITLVCGVLLVVGLALIVAWGGKPFVPPAGGQESLLQRYAWWITLITVAGFGSGLVLAGAGGRLVMRVLAMTSTQSTGRITEAGAVIGTISEEGTVSFLFFGAIPAGYFSAILYLAIRRWLPGGRLGGLVFGLILLLIAAPTIDPLRADNIDFQLVGPGWLAVALFSALALAQGMLVAAITGWYSAHLPPFLPQPWPAYVPMLASAIFVPAGIVFTAGAVVTWIFAPLIRRVTRWASRWMFAPAGIWVGRGLVAVIALAAIPGFVSSAIQIVSV